MIVTAGRTVAIDLIRGGDSVIPDTMIGELDLETERRGVAAELAE